MPSSLSPMACSPPMRWCSSAWACPGARPTTWAPSWQWSTTCLTHGPFPPSASVLAGGNVRVGLEDNLMLDRGVPATNAQLVERAARIIENLGARVIGPDEVRARLNLTKRAPQ